MRLPTSRCVNACVIPRYVSQPLRHWRLQRRLSDSGPAEVGCAAEHAGTAAQSTLDTAGAALRRAGSGDCLKSK